jgi:hypothetical protein
MKKLKQIEFGNVLRCLILRECHELRMFNKRALRRICLPKREGNKRTEKL